MIIANPVQTVCICHNISLSLSSPEPKHFLIKVCCILTSSEPLCQIPIASKLDFNPYFNSNKGPNFLLKRDIWRDGIDAFIDIMWKSYNHLDQFQPNLTQYIINESCMRYLVVFLIWNATRVIEVFQGSNLVSSSFSFLMKLLFIGFCFSWSQLGKGGGVCVLKIIWQVSQKFNKNHQIQYNGKSPDIHGTNDVYTYLK